MRLEGDFAALVDALPGLVWLASPGGNVNFVNRRWRDYTGINLMQASGSGWQSAVHRVDLLDLREHWQRTLASGEPGEIEVRLRRRDGAYRWFQISSNPVRDDAGGIVQWCALSTDIDSRRPAEKTEQLDLQDSDGEGHQFEEKLATGQADLRSIIDSVPMTAWSARVDGYCDFVNRRWLDYAGLSLDQVVGWGWTAAIHPDDLPGLVLEWQSCLASGEPMNAEARMRRFDGVYRWFLFLGNPLRDDAGHVVKWFGTNVDVEDRRRVEEALRASERNLNQIINTLPTTAWATRPDGYCEFLSDRWLDYAGFTAAEALGWNWSSVIHPDDAAALIEYWQGCLATGTPVDTEARMRRFDGEYRWFLFRANPWRDEAGNIVKWYGTNVDIEDRKRADQALQASERNLYQIINTIPTTAWSTRPDGYCDFLSDRWLDYAGFTQEEAIGWNWSSVIHEGDAAGLIEYWQRCLASGTPVDAEARMRRFDGEYRWFLFRANPLRDVAGNIVKWYGTNVDIEDRKKADEALRASERNLSLIINTMPMLAWSTRPDGFCDFVNQRWIEFTGMSTEKARGWDWEAAIHPEDVNGLVEYWQCALATGQPMDTEARMRRFDGVYRWFLFRGNPLCDEQGRIVRWYGTNVDIEDRKRAEEKLRRSEVLLAEGQRVSLTGSFYWSVDTDGIRASEQLHRILGLEPGTPIALSEVAERVHPEDIPLLREKIALARGGKGEIEHEVRLRMPDDSLKYLRVNAYRDRDRDGRLEYVGAIQDVTERRRSEEALAGVRSALAQMTRAASMGVLAASIAHEVNQPLTGIITNGGTCLRMLAADPPNVEGALETVRRTIRDGNRAAAVIARLRALYAKGETAIELVDLNEAAREVLALLASELQRNRVHVRTELAKALPLVMGDRIQLQQVILNLLVNAFAAMSTVDDRPRLLVLSTEQDLEGGVRLSVEDNGVGVSGDDRERIFEAFYTTKSNGLGIGLSVSRTIVENHEGRLWASPNTGSGTTFVFTIPSRLVSGTSDPD
ncbi:PAS domain-containing protein [Variovorax saccharolyticus]|uniref:PAS domain-containing protein n=1 Tax=Variovorax saccharolyticus TaxID=3053516 RepID=UPI0025773AE6|nr:MULTISPECIES: PAS domain-containing protein [unclassified Variovorax]MDM0022304.1 PAS domain-containing protein [Variovorax sp. J22R187]MDM0028860.1 PAS domain-containing protein [Variovorax sp. J31P216]